MSTLAARPEHATRALDRAAFARAISASDPAGPCLRDDGLYDAIREAARAQFGDEAFGIPEKRPDWQETERLCRDALETKTKDLYVLVAYAEASTQTRGAAGLADAAWGIARLHADFGDTFHPQPAADGSCEARGRLIELLVRRLRPILSDWDTTARRHRRTRRPEDADLIASARASLQAAAESIVSRYGTHAVSLAPMLEALAQVEEAVPGGTTPDAAPDESGAEPAPAPAMTPTPAACLDSAWATLAARVPMWEALVTRIRADGMPRLPVPEPTRRRHLEQLFATERWRELLAEVEATLATDASAPIWLDLQRYTAGALGQLGAAYVGARRWLIVGLRGVMHLCPGIETGTFADGSPVADPATRRWLDAEVAPAGVRATPTAEPDPTPSGTASAQETSRRARYMAQRQHAGELLRAEKAMAAAGLLRRLADEARQRDLATWEGPAFAAATLSLLCRAYDHVAKRGGAPSGLQARRFEAHEELLGLDPDHSQNLPE